MTSDPGSPEASEGLLRQARGWVLLLRSGEASQIDVDALQRWRAENPAHRRAFAEANAQWEVLRSAARSVAAAERAADRRGPSRRTLLTGGAMAASLAGGAYLAAWPPLGLWPSLSELAADYRTDVGERRKLAFANDVSVEMNTRTSLAVARTETDAGQVELIAGEIAITTGEAASPFVVVAANGRASAARATFDLRHDEQGVSITCLDGEVAVECQNSKVALKAHQRIAYGVDGLSEIATTDCRVVEAWRQGLLIFDDQPLSRVIPEINRYRRGKIILMNDEVGRLPLDATFRIDRIDEVVPKIVHIFNLKARTLPGDVVLLS